MLAVETSRRKVSSSVAQECPSSARYCKRASLQERGLPARVSHKLELQSVSCSGLWALLPKTCKILSRMLSSC